VEIRTKKNSPQTRHRAEQIEEESRGKPRVTEDRYSVANQSLFSYFAATPLGAAAANLYQLFVDGGGFRKSQLTL
jgi:hypothetical protein